jgi:hypothetical protein
VTNCDRTGGIQPQNLEPGKEGGRGIWFIEFIGLVGLLEFVGLLELQEANKLLF